jgi:hypothetical protein
VRFHVLIFTFLFVLFFDLTHFNLRFDFDFWKLECGVQSLRANSGTNGLNKMAEPGDWPWHVALFKEGVHVCDATLVADNWLLTTAYCFQG